VLNWLGWQSGEEVGFSFSHVRFSIDKQFKTTTPPWACWNDKINMRILHMQPVLSCHRHVICTRTERHPETRCKWWSALLLSSPIGAGSFALFVYSCFQLSYTKCAYIMVVQFHPFNVMINCIIGTSSFISVLVTYLVVLDVMAGY